ncbi:molybdopterin-dependent oxidoreductase [Corynebacterium guangdongense]|uniref:DMSO/TMAO reductase YedYZ molybdopterin-dependent catalytic subunit n=1 Tax=Corynebacterium guangdongense TaxID=1783348 RepID=A0ABU1ZXX3_9CORY|nr:molybdopterin-dependent oxidoreductase [Corynebacterium guangdongense]MDR7329695.1 DMSO/TMAO reductase YedYZ molybdopterin-dependent catalytic subunit [Corynebacterium guangdongense]WJZ18259.1 TMAO/DMSO reductase [Corynebacterium guangdongense]
MDLVANPDFPLWLRASHLINFILIGMLLRSGVEMLSSLPRLWWRNDCAPGTEWLRFTQRKLPKEEGVYTSLMDEKSVSPIWSLPGRENIGLGRHWHGVSVMLWVLNGIVYVTLLFATGLWRRIIPTSWDVFPQAWESALIYLSLDVPSIEHFSPYDALQMLAYTFVIFILAPFMMLTGVAMSPAVRSRYTWYVKLWGGHQGARSLHFIGMVLMSAFIVVHVGLVFFVHGPHNWMHMAFGAEYDPAYVAQAFTTIVATVVVVILFWIGLSYWSLADRARAQRVTAGISEIGRKIFLNWMRPRSARQNSFTDADISEFHWTNGLPPTEDESAYWVQQRDNDYEDYEITLGDDINQRSRVVTLEQIRTLAQTSYIATHTCMQGWSATSRWTGVRLRDLMPLLGERPEGANFLMIESYGLAQKMYDNRPREPFYAVIDAATAEEDDSILAYERNGAPIDNHLGAPARLRVESNHGYKAVKWVSRIAWIHDYADYGDGRGGTREDSALQAFNGRI